MIRRRNTSSRLRQKLTLQEEQRTADGAGGYVRSWKDVAELWAEITPVSGREKLFAMQLDSSITHRVLVRYRQTITAGHRLVNDDRRFNILSVTSVNQDETLELLVEESAVNA